MVVAMLNRVCTRPIWVWVILPEAHAGLPTEKYRMAPMEKMAVPMMLNSKCISPAVFALRLAPRPDSRAVMQVPMFWPIII